MNDLDQTLRLAAAASVGPWTSTWANAAEYSLSGRTVDGPKYVEGYSNHEMDAADAEFIAHARTALPAYASALKQILAAHAPRDIYDDCDCAEPALDTDRHERVDGIGLTCNKFATVCRECCCDQHGDRTAACEWEHPHDDVDGYHCATARLAAGVRA